MSVNAKQRFIQRGEQAKAWANFTASEMFIEATQTALLHMHATMPLPKDMANASVNEIQMRGARLFLDHLTNLGTVAEPEKRVTEDRNLDHTV